MGLKTYQAHVVGHSTTVVLKIFPRCVLTGAFIYKYIHMAYTHSFDYIISVCYAGRFSFLFLKRSSTRLCGKTNKHIICLANDDDERAKLFTEYTFLFHTFYSFFMRRLNL